ncbi:MAG TPA: hypothetical protein VLT47_01855 [Anaeromyxobacteraceae bacterium]|nr:hypothetical protein [Anaeromyxobacteraceae bacterium]
MKASRFFRFANRANSLLLFVLLAVGAVALLAAGVAEVWSHLGRHRPEARGAGSPGEERLELQAPVAIEGTAVTIVPRSGAWEARGYSSGEGGRETRNLLFHDVSTGRMHWLRPKDDAAIIDWEVLREGEVAASYEEEPGRGARGKGPPLAVRYEIAEADTDGDGVIGAGDRLQVGVSGVAGDGYATVLRDVDELRGRSAPSGGRLALFFRRGEKEWVAEVDLAARRLVRETPLPER